MATFVTVTDVTPTVDGTYQDIDLSAHLPVSATGAILEIHNPAGAANYNYYLRKNGSTDDYYGDILSGHTWWIVGVDGSQICEGKFESGSGIKVYLHGYVGSEAVLNTNATDKTPGSASTWVDVDISSDTGGDTAVAAIVNRFKSSGAGSFDIRKNGSTDDFTARNVNQTDQFIVGVDGSEIFEANISSTSADDVLLIGYFTESISMNTNGSDESLTTTGSYQDLTALAGTAVGGIYRAFKLGGGFLDMNIQEKGATENVYDTTNAQYSSVLVECNGSQLCEGKISDTIMDFYEMGYLEASPSGSSRRVFCVG